MTDKKKRVLTDEQKQKKAAADKARRQRNKQEATARQGAPDVIGQELASSAAVERTALQAAGLLPAAVGELDRLAQTQGFQSFDEALNARDAEYEKITDVEFADAEDAIAGRVEDDALAALPEADKLLIEATTEADRAQQLIEVVEDELNGLPPQATPEEIEALMADVEDTPGLTVSQRDQVSKLQTETLVFEMIVSRTGFKRRVSTDEVIKEDLDGAQTKDEVVNELNGAQFELIPAVTNQTDDQAAAEGGETAETNGQPKELTKREKELARRKLVRVTKNILECPELDAIEQTVRDFKAWLKQRQLRCSLLRGGRYVIPTAYVAEVENRFNEFKALRRDATRKFLLVYEQRIAEAEAEFKRAGIKAIFRRSDFPSLRELANSFVVRREWQAFDAPKALQKINAKLWTDAENQIAIQLAGVADEAGNALRSTFAGYIGWLADRLTQEEGQTKKKAINDNKVAQMLDFLGAVDKLNIGNDEDLTRLAKQARDVLTGIEVKDLKKNDAVRDALQKSFTQLQEATTGWVIERDRVICFNEDDV